MPTPPQGYSQDGHGHLQPGAPGYYQHGILHRQQSPSHLMPPPPLPLDPALVGPHNQLQANAHSPSQYAYPPVFNQPHQQSAQTRPPPVPYSMNQFSNSTEENASDDENEDLASDEEPVPDKRGTKKRAAKSAGGTASKKAKQSAALENDEDDEASPAAGGETSSKPKAT
ncbi:hypothetical protein FRC09_005232, partial [Ceratobasidium sp. 395]